MRWRIVLGLACVSVASLVATIDPLLMRALIDRALPQRDLRWALELAGAIGLCYIGRSALSAAGSLVNFSIAQRCVRDLRVELLDQINRLSADYHEQTPTGEKLTRIEHDVDEIANLGADTANQSVRAILFFALNLAMMAKLNLLMTLTVLPLMPLFAMVQRRFSVLLKTRAEDTFGSTSEDDGPTFLSQLLFYSAAISASKRIPSTGYKYALRVNPSSGNLHPTEFHFVTRGLKEWPDGLYHYDPSRHMAEQRGRGTFEMGLASGPAPIVFLLTSIAWREAWKYGERAYRYCLHDIGHAWQALALSAQAIGCDTFAVGNFLDDEVDQLCRPNQDEWPMLMVSLHGESIPVRQADTGKTVWFGGQANLLSEATIAHPLIDGIHFATKQSSGARSGTSFAEPAPSGSGEIELPPPASSTRSFGEVARMRRSALDFLGGMQSMSLAGLSAILAAAAQPLVADFTGTRFIQLYLYAHRVDGLQPGIYRFWPERAELEQVKSGDQRVPAAGLSLGQDLAGNACVTFSMIGDLDRAADTYGDRGYRYVHFEAGAIGQRLYLAAEALGLGATGIGAFFDDEVHRHLNLTTKQGQVVYHFAIGYPVPDPRISASNDPLETTR
jgi:SagB-type dehydrogenase family enzyme